MNDKIIQLIISLTTKTNGQKLIWQRTSRMNEFKTNLLNGSVSIDHWFDSGKDYIEFKVFNNFGEEIGSWKLNSNDFNFGSLAILHSAILMNFNKVDKTIDDMLGELSC